MFSRNYKVCILDKPCLTQKYSREEAGLYWAVGSHPSHNVCVIYIIRHLPGRKEGA